MTILHPIEIEGRVEALLLGSDADNDTVNSRQVDDVEVTFEGFAGDRHLGLFAHADVRYAKQYKKGTPIRKTRQVSMLSVEDLAQIASNLDVERIEPGWMCGNLVVSGIPKFTELPPSTRLIFSSGAAIVVDNENQACSFVGRIIDQHCPGTKPHFVAAARNLRGLVGWVEREGHIRVGDKIALHIPPQRLYDPGS